jgi:parallel beta-helix repeat protein
MLGTYGPHPRSARVVALGLILSLVFGGADLLDSDPASAGPVACGETITADTTLESDLVDCPNNGIIIGADDITLDLNGHMIDGDDVLVDSCPKNEACDVGVLNDGHNGVTITGGTVKEFALGALVFSARRNILRGLTTFEHVFGGFTLVQVVRSSVRGSTASQNAGPDSGVGITLFESNNNRIVGNAFFDNRELGIHLILSDHNYVAKNRVRDNPEDGIILQGDGNKIVDNRVVRNSIGVTIFQKPARAVGNVVARNHVRRGPRGGIYVDSVPERTVIKRNHVFRTGRHGILIGNPTTIVTRNEARYNDDLGIKAVKGVIDGGGNRASGNGNRRQCVNISCN